MEILVRNEEFWYPIFFKAYQLFEKSMKIDEFRSPFGSTQAMQSVIFMKFQFGIRPWWIIGQVDFVASK